MSLLNSNLEPSGFCFHFGHTQTCQSCISPRKMCCECRDVHYLIPIWACLFILLKDLWVSYFCICSFGVTIVEVLCVDTPNLQTHNCEIATRFVKVAIQSIKLITRNLVLSNHPICNYMWLSVICNYVL